MSTARYSRRLAPVGSGRLPTSAPAGSGMASRAQVGATETRSAPRASSPTAPMNLAAPSPSATAWLNRKPTTKPPHSNAVTWTSRISLLSSWWVGLGSGCGSRSSLGIWSGYSR
uniref:Uncharacterized protein n=1 Tax=Zea mays TaxID=4577 RepID=C4J4J4_MAIZE|nr:unknown [Zea mays]